MQVESRDREGVKIVEVRGKLMGEAAAVALRRSLRTVLDEGGRRLLVVLWAVPVIDSGAVGELLAALTSARRRGGELKLLSPSPRVEDILRITDLRRLFEIFSDEDQAVASFC